MAAKVGSARPVEELDQAPTTPARVGPHDVRRIDVDARRGTVMLAAVMTSRPSPDTGRRRVVLVKPDSCSMRTTLPGGSR